MGLAAIFLACSFVAIWISSPANAQSPPAPLLPPSPAPAPAPHFVNLADLLSVAGPFHTFLNYLEQTQVIQTFQNQANNTKQGITIFVPKDSAFSSLKKTTFSNLTKDQLKTLLLYHALPKFYSLSEFNNLSALNPVSTFAGGAYTLNLTDNSGLIHVASTWSNSKISSSVYTTPPVAVYEVDKVLLPVAIFSTNPPLAPAPAPAPETTKPSDLAPSSRSGTGSAPKSSESSTTENSAYSISINLFSYFVMASSSLLMLML
uniref:Fasciclin-like arabinogalactan protein 7 n=1 Tax=Elaeis guineensis var. tenera TaxID=51953 RepID=A0A6I9RL68_ELAGV|nr:fasciclin-like arabinogalactan protein 7 [Elaeis guineensis]XP_010928516.1 fasciclin-like arabinogalactan protein 7 [Elaeis guineensis]XP_010928518.1 fasciclin-like arabinogalactan protein 7 [Elaeis guineensis]